ncbi:MAG: hypothetical protein J5I50_01775 [Chitinophagaceae bacterium]|nr:hypothetical protein [Chitinophagaceae bacterium]
MKQILWVATAFLTLNANAQILNNKKNTINSNLGEVITDYFKNFSNAKGDTLSAMASVITFDSRIKLPGALSCIIKKYPLPNTYSWEGFLCESDDFDLASEQYKKVFQQINNMKFSPDGSGSYPLKGRIDYPSEQRSFASTHLKFEAPEEELRLKNFMVDLELTYRMPVWQLRLYLYEKLPDDEIRPGTRSISH